MLTLFIKPKISAKIANTIIELWIAQRKLPARAKSDAMIVPVAPDLKMIFGVAKRVRDYGGNAAQYEADRVAPLEPGQAFIGPGGRYRFDHTVLAVIFDTYKRTSPELITRAIDSAMQQALRKGAESIILPDMTENLLAQPTWITAEQRLSTADTTAKILIDAITSSSRVVPIVRIWCWDPANAPAYEREIRRAQQQPASAVASTPAHEEIEQGGETQEWNEYGATTQIKTTTVTVVYGDPLRIDADAIFRPTNTQFELDQPVHDAYPAEEDAIPGAHVTPPAAHSSLSARILATAGAYVMEEARSHGTVAPGRAILTEAGGLPQVRGIIHLTTRIGSGPATAETLRKSLEAGLTLADLHHLKSLVIPNIGAGANDYPDHISAPLIVDTIGTYMHTLGRNSGIERIYLASETSTEEEMFASALERFYPLPIPLPGPAPEEH